MRLIKILLPAVALAAAVLLNACSSPVQPEPVKEPDKLRPSLIYNIDSIKAFVDARKGVDSTAAQQLEKAKEFLPLFPRKALYHVKSSISAKPSQEAYVQLAALLAEVNEYTEAKQAFTVLSKVFPGFDRKLHLDMLCIALLDPADGSLYPFDDLAMKAGIKKEEIRNMLLNDKRLADFRKTKRFVNLLQYFSNPADVEEDHDYYRYLNEFPHEYTYMDKSDNIRIGIDLKKLVEINPEENARIWGFKKYIEEFRKPGHFRFMPVVRFYDGRYETLIYAIDSSAYAAKKDMMMTYYRMVTYMDKEQIDSRVIAKHQGEDVSTALIQMYATAEMSEMKIEVERFRRTFRKPFYYKDNSNEVTGMESVGKETITINEKGKIVSKKRK